MRRARSIAGDSANLLLYRELARSYDEVEEAKGSEEEMIGLIQKKYGKTREDAKSMIDNLSLA